MPEKKPKWMDATLDHLKEMVVDDSYTIDEISDYVKAKLIESFKNGVDTQKGRKSRPHGERKEKGGKPHRTYDDQGA